MKRQMHLGMALHAFGCHRASWRHPEVPRGDMTDFDLHLAIAKKTEEGLFDFLFASDSLTANWSYKPELAGRQPPLRALDAFTLIAALMPVTKRIGLVATVNTSYGGHPYNVARAVASLDLMSGGRAGWNLVTGLNPDEAPNFTDQPHMSAEARYERGTEYARVMFGLWDSWDDDAILCDKAAGQYYDPAKMHQLDFHGKYFHSRGPLTMPRTPQGRPVTVQAGSSDAGMTLAAETADVVFSVAGTLEHAQEFYRDVKGRLPRFGRRPEDLKILLGVQVHVGKTDVEARAKLEAMEASFDIPSALNELNMLFLGDLRSYDLDAPFPDLPVNDQRGSRPHVVREIAQANSYTLREMALKYGSFGHWILTGTPETIVDELQVFFENGACDGYIVQPPYMTGGIDDFVDLVVPELQRRGLYRTAYEGTTLRDHLGLSAPARGGAPELALDVA